MIAIGQLFEALQGQRFAAFAQRQRQLFLRRRRGRQESHKHQCRMKNEE